MYQNVIAEKVGNDSQISITFSFAALRANRRAHGCKHYQDYLVI